MHGGYDEDEMEDTRVEGLDNGDELGLGDGSHGSSGSVINRPSSPGAGNSQQDSEKALQLRLEIIPAEREAREAVETERERMAD